MPGYASVNSKVIRVPLTRGVPVLAKRGAMLAYSGEVTFSPALSGAGGGPMPGMGAMAGMMGRALAGESAAMMAAEGSGDVFYGYRGLHTHLVHLDGSEPIVAESDRLLVHDAALSVSTVALGQQSGGMVRGAVRGALTGQGLFTTQLTGAGSVALLAHGGVLPIVVDGSHPVVVDPQAYVGHTGALHLDVSAKVGWRDAVGRGSGEAIQLKVTGRGTLFVQASEQKF